MLIWGAALTAVSLLLDGLLPARTPAFALIALGAATGLSTPPLAACARALLPGLVADPARLRALFALESTALELTFILGPPMALGLGALTSTGAALTISGLLLLVGTLAFAAHPVSRRWRPELTQRSRGCSLRAPAMRTLILILLALGAAFGATDVGVVDAAHTRGSASSAGPILGVWGIGSLLGGITATRLGGGAGTVSRLVSLLGALALAHAALILTTGSLLAMGATILVAGATIAPTVASLYAIVNAATPTGTRTEAFSWLVAASSTGTALGASVAGALAQNAGATGAFEFTGAAAGLAVMTALARRRRLEAIHPPS